MSTALTAFGAACLVTWIGLWAYMMALQKRVDRLEEDLVGRDQDPGAGIQDSGQTRN